MKLDITNAQCIVETKSITYKTYYNLCDGTIINRPYGTLDMVVGYGVFLIFVLLIGFCFWMMRQGY